MHAEKLHPSGAWRVSDIVRGYRESIVYYGYTKAQALEQFATEHMLCELCGESAGEGGALCPACQESR
jgi:hypothetical protein